MKIKELKKGRNKFSSLLYISNLNKLYLEVIYVFIIRDFFAQQIKKNFM